MKSKLILTIVSFLAAFICFATPPVEEGKVIFTSRCASCHSVNKVLTGPALAGVHERRSIDWIVSFVQSSQALVKSGDKDAIAVFEKFNKIPMPDHSDLSADHVKSIVEFIKSESATAGEEKAPFAKPASIKVNYTPLSIYNYGFFIGFLAVIGLLIAALLFAVQLKQYERSRLAKK